MSLQVRRAVSSGQAVGGSPVRGVDQEALQLGYPEGPGELLGEDPAGMEASPSRFDRGGDQRLGEPQGGQLPDELGRQEIRQAFGAGGVAGELGGVDGAPEEPPVFPQGEDRGMGLGTDPVHRPLPEAAQAGRTDRAAGRGAAQAGSRTEEAEEVVEEGEHPSE